MGSVVDSLGRGLVGVGVQGVVPVSARVWQIPVYCALPDPMRFEGSGLS